MNKNKRKKICFVSSTGGHFEQLSMLRPLMEKYDSCIVTEKANYDFFIEGQNMYHLFQANRKEILMPIWMLMNLFISIRVLLIERPDIIITTGALSVLPLCMLGKLFKKKLVYIESYAIVSSPSRTGKFLYRYSDRFYVQWESMKKFYPDAIFVGGVY